MSVCHTEARDGAELEEALDGFVYVLTSQSSERKQLVAGTTKRTVALAQEMQVVLLSF